jgi:hypothetical protein
MSEYAKWPEFVKYLEEIVPRVDVACERDFSDRVNHPVRLLSLRGWRKGINTLWLVCGCDVKESLTRVIHTGQCKPKERARQILLQEIREQNYSRWCAMSLADVIYDVWNMHKAGTYIGSPGLEIPPGAFQLIELLTPPRKDESPCGSCYPGKREDFWPALYELERQKLLKIDGLAIGDYEEHFQFPKDLRSKLEQWIIENDPHCGFGGVGTVWDICRKVARRTGWKKGETVFGKDNIPWMTEAVAERCWNVWIPALDIRLADKKYPDKDVVIDEIPVEVWVGWLKFIRRDLIEHDLF